MGVTSPQRHANANNALIVVRSVDWLGLPSDFNTRVAASPIAIGREVHLTGEISVYALGQNVKTAVVGPGNEYRLSNGTSFAAPQIAGLAAYFLGLPGLKWPKGSVSKVMKDYIVNGRREFVPSFDGFDVASNKVWEIMQYCQLGSSVLPPQKRRRWFSGLLDILDTTANKFKRQNRNHETTIFENGHLKDSKYSNDVSGCYRSDHQ